MIATAAGAPLVVLPDGLAALLPPEDARYGLFLATAPSAIFNGAASLLTYRYLAGDRMSVGGALARAVRRWPSLWGAGVVGGLAILVGLVLLVVPGLVLMGSFAAGSSPDADLTGNTAMQGPPRAFEPLTHLGWPNVRTAAKSLGRRVRRACWKDDVTAVR